MTVLLSPHFSQRALFLGTTSSISPNTMVLLNMIWEILSQSALDPWLESIRSQMCFLFPLPHNSHLAFHSPTSPLWDSSTLNLSFRSSYSLAVLWDCMSPSSMEISLGQKPCHMFLSSQILHFPALCSAVLDTRETPNRPELSQVPFNI